MAFLRKIAAVTVKTWTSASVYGSKLLSTPNSIQPRLMSTACSLSQPSQYQCVKLESSSIIPKRCGITANLLSGNNPVQFLQARSRVYQSYKSAKPKTVTSVVERFKRLGCGQWIRTRAGRHKHLWKKTPAVRAELTTHVLCNKRQNWLLERMVGKYWKRHRHYPKDPYAPYHVRNAFHNDKVYKKAPFYP